MRVFFAHASTCGLSEIRYKTKKLGETLAARAEEAGKEPSSIQIVPGRLDHQKNWRGSWDSWTYGVVSRRDAVTGKYVYDAFVIERTTCGRATAAILSEALRLKRLVFFWDGEEGLARVGAIEEFDSNDWTGGWRVIRGGEEE